MAAVKMGKSKSRSQTARRTKPKAATKKTKTKKTLSRSKKKKALLTARIEVVALPHHDDLPLPSYQTPLSAGMDLYAAIPKRRPLTLAPGQRELVPTGLTIALPAGYEAQVRPRSGLALKHGITCLNTPGTIDADYRGEVKVILINLGQESFTIKRGERIAQMVIAPVTQGAWDVVDVLSETARGAGGFGSTGRG